MNAHLGLLGPKSLTMTWSGFASVNLDMSDPEFEFVFENQRLFRVHSVLAEFLSPKVAQLRRSDVTFCRYIFNASDCYDVFETLVKALSRGTAFEVTESNLGSLFEIADELENTELTSKLLDLTEIDNITVEDALFFLAMPKHRSIFGSRVQDMRTFVASHFFELPNEKLAKLDLETLSSILSDPQLKLQDEDSLYDFVSSQMKIDLSFARLLEYVRPEYLTIPRIEDLSTFIEQNLLNDISPGIWKQISRRLILTPSMTFAEERVSSRRFLEKTFDYISPRPLDGVIAHLTREFGGNVHDEGIVEITSSGMYNNATHYHPKHAADLEEDSIYYSTNIQDTWICYNFKDRRISPTHYTIRSNSDGGRGVNGWHNLKSWVIEGSNDQKTWDILDQRENNNDLDRRNAIYTFQISPEKCKQSYQYLRLRVTGPNHCSAGTYYILTIASLEYFGRLFNDRPARLATFSTQQDSYMALPKVTH